MPNFKRLGTVEPFLKLVEDRDTQWNFDQIAKHLSELCPVCKGVETDLLTLTVGVNLVSPGVKTPRGRIVTYQSAVSDITDQGLVNGKWQITVSAACQCRFLFF